ncbi:hypothetical protein AWB78_01345 [Caballeronia calidae]|uniref:Phage baseplate assembly protein V n=1 Tax=Caballeronia calidae TaxID=1777139 RepID=A0A158A968_9BURK|nr:hypothetical protein [Caballeronia calidae]SAK53637.1 hypothetical protein AWB78_01345 [Caballeronia calidae]
MADNYSKLWLQNSLNQVAITRAQQAIESLGRALPCRVTAVEGAIVTIAFEMDTAPWTLPPITIPKAESPWIRMPTQVGDQGVTMPADVYLGGVSGLGVGTADFRQAGNLEALVFVPVSNASSPPIDQDAAQVQGPNGTILRTTEGTTSSIVTDQNGTTITFGTTSLVINATGITLTVDGQTFTWGGSRAVSTLPIQAPDVVLPNGGVNGHYHSGVQHGSDNTDPMTG